MRNTIECIHGDVLSLAIDESNHGLFPEIYCGVFSKIKKDTLKSRKRLDKERKDFSKIISEVNQRAYSFLVVASKEDYKRVGYEKMTGIVAASLLNGINIDFEFLRIIVDGIPPGKGKDYVVGPVSECLNIDAGRITFNCGKDFDIQYPLVYLADGMARYLHRQKLEDLALNQNRKHLIK